MDLTADKSDGAALAIRLARTSIRLSTEKNHGALLQHILEEAKAIARADGGTLYILNQHDQLEHHIMRTDSLGLAMGGDGFPPAQLDPIPLYDAHTGEPRLSTQVVYAVLTGQTIQIADVYNTATEFNFLGTQRFDEQFGYRTQSVLTIPLINHKKEAIGCLQLVNAQDLTGKTIPFSDEMAEIVSALASQAAVILDNRQLIDAQRDLLESFIKIIAQAIDAKSPYTGNHCERVPALTEMIAAAACAASEGPFAEFNLSDEEKYELHIAGWLHDCGKIVTPVHIMDKSTKLETIHDLIDSVVTRFEVLKRDARIAYLEALQAGANAEAEKNRYYNAIAMLDDQCAFLERINIGGEYVDDADLERLDAIAQLQWECQGSQMPLLHSNEHYNLKVRRGTINAEEREIMNDHMAHTINMLESMPWPKHLLRVPEYACGHHEKMDGTGYPRGLLAGTMSIPARMMAIADVFEALTAADRPYKPAKKLSEAMAIIGRLKQQNHLDPGLVDFFVTSGVYRDYATRFLAAEQSDAVDEAAILAIEPEAMNLRMRQSGDA